MKNSNEDTIQKRPTTPSRELSTKRFLNILFEKLIEPEIQRQSEEYVAISKANRLKREAESKGSKNSPQTNPQDKKSPQR